MFYTNFCNLNFYFKLTNRLLPQYFYSFPYSFYSYLKTNHDIHFHNTRQRHNLHITRVKHEFSKRCIRYDLSSQINVTPTVITDKINTHSFSGLYMYNIMIDVMIILYPFFLSYHGLVYKIIHMIVVFQFKTSKGWTPCSIEIPWYNFVILYVK